jgi:putative phosphoesterase
MRIGVVSDTHDQIERTRRAVKLLRDNGADVLVHCGDVVEPELVAELAEQPFYMAFGNNDSDTVPRLRCAIGDAGGTCLEWGGEVVLAGKRIAITHGHMHTDVRRLLAAKPDYLLSGHSHIASDRRDGPLRRINPGALYRASKFTVDLLDPAIDDVKFLTIPR